jgi:5'-deoxynucleotidase YfbR-like HD superfamily hydrolase
MTPKKFKKDIKTTYDFMSHVYMGNWEYRFKGTPHMSNILRKRKSESVLSHELACIGLWFNLRRICPNLNKLVNSEKIYEILWTHDLGEIFAGDVSLTHQVNGRGSNKHQIEREEIVKMAGNIPKQTLSELLGNFDAFEKKIEEIDDIEILVCKLIDNIEGHHFALIFGNDFNKHSEIINKILNYSFIPRANRLLEILKEKKHDKAHQEVKWIINSFIELFKKAGVRLKLDKIV